jgi:hypothetical protein
MTEATPTTANRTLHNGVVPANDPVNVAKLPSCRFRFIPTWCGTQRDTSSPIKARTLDWEFTIDGQIYGLGAGSI